MSPPASGREKSAANIQSHPNIPSPKFAHQSSWSRRPRTVDAAKLLRFSHTPIARAIFMWKVAHWAHPSNALPFPPHPPKIHPNASAIVVVGCGCRRCRHDRPTDRPTLVRVECFASRCHIKWPTMVDGRQVLICHSNATQLQPSAPVERNGSLGTPRNSL